MGHYLPTKLPSYLLLLRLSHQYARKKKDLERDLIAASRVYVIEEATYDNWAGGTYGHDVQIFFLSRN